MTAVAGFNTEIVGAADPGQVASGIGLENAGLVGPRDPILRSTAISFQSNWQSQLARMTASTDSPGDHAKDRIGVGNATTSTLSDLAEPDGKQSAAFPSQWTSRNFSNAAQPQQTSDQAATFRSVPNTLQDSDSLKAGSAGRHSLSSTHTPESSTEATGGGRASRKPGSAAHASKDPTPGQAVESSQPSLEAAFGPLPGPVQNSLSADPGQEPQQSNGSSEFSLSAPSAVGWNEYPISSAPISSLAQISSAQTSAGTHAGLNSAKTDCPTQDDPASLQTRGAASIETGDKTQAASGSLQPLQHLSPIIPSACVPTEPSSQIPFSEQGIQPSRTSTATPALKPSQALSASGISSQNFAASEIYPESFQSQQRGPSHAPNGSELKSDAALETALGVYKLTRVNDSKSNPAKLTAEGSATALNSTAVATTNAVHPSLQKPGAALSTEPAMVSGFASPARFVDSAPASQSNLDRVQAGRVASETFNALDSAVSAPNASWGHINARQAEAGFQDSSLGWVSIRAELSGGSVHATLAGSSPEAAQALGGHIAGLSAYLAENRTPVETLTIASPAGNGQMGFGAGDHAGNREAEQNSRSGSESPDPMAGPQNAEARPGVLSVGNAIDRAAMHANRGGTYISVIA